MRTLANREDPDELPHNAAIHQGLHLYFVKKKTRFRERNTIVFGNLTRGSSNQMDHSKCLHVCFKPEGLIH